MPEKKNRKSVLDTVLGTIKPVLATTKTKLLTQMFRSFLIAKEKEIREELGVTEKKNIVKRLTAIFREYMEELDEDEDEGEDEEDEKEEKPKEA